MELKNGINRNNSWYTLVSVAQMRPDSKKALPAHAHSLDSILKPWNHSPLAEPKRARLVFLDLVSTVKKQIVSNIHNAAGLGGWPLTQDEIFVFDSSAATIHLRCPTSEISGEPIARRAHGHRTRARPLWIEGLGSIIARVAAAPPRKQGIRQGGHHAAQQHHANAQGQQKVSFAPNTRFGSRYAACESDIHNWIARAHNQPDPESGEQGGAVASHGEQCRIALWVTGAM